MLISQPWFPFHNQFKGGEEHNTIWPKNNQILENRQETHTILAHLSFACKRSSNGPLPYWYIYHIDSWMSTKRLPTAKCNFLLILGLHGQEKEASFIIFVWKIDSGLGYGAIRPNGKLLSLLSSSSSASSRVFPLLFQAYTIPTWQPLQVLSRAGTNTRRPSCKCPSWQRMCKRSFCASQFHLRRVSQSGTWYRLI